MNTAVIESEAPSWQMNWKIMAAFLALAGVTIGLCRLDYKHQTIPETGVVMNLPERIGSFRGKDQPISEGERVILPKDTEIAKKAYTDINGDLVNCQIVLSGSDKRSIHRPEICLPGQGWNIREASTLPIKLNSGKTLKVTKLRLVRTVEVSAGEKKPLTMLFLYWFVGNNYTTPSHMKRILKTNLDMLLYNHAHRWAYVIVSAPVLEGFKYDGKNEQQTLEMLKAFLPEVVPFFQKSEMEPALSSAPAK